jgi:RimJ/RimL family protein N-acetyltransferase
MLRPLEHSDAPELLRIYADPEFTRYWSCAPWTSPTQATEYIEKSQRDLDTGESLRLGIVLDAHAQLIGTCSLFNLMVQCRRAELGYGIAPAHWRQGYMFEAVSELIRHAFDALHLNRLEADIDPRNAASAHSLEKLGFVREGYLRERWIVDEEVSDTALYGLLAREWRARTGHQPER